MFYSHEMHSTFKPHTCSLCKATLREASCPCKCFEEWLITVFSLKCMKQGHTKESQDIQEQIIIACSRSSDTHMRSITTFTNTALFNVALTCNLVTNTHFVDRRRMKTDHGCESNWGCSYCYILTFVLLLD